MQKSISFQITTWNALDFRQISGIRLFLFQIAVILYDQRNAVSCNSVIEESSLH